MLTVTCKVFGAVWNPAEPDIVATGFVDYFHLIYMVCSSYTNILGPRTPLREYGIGMILRPRYKKIVRLVSQSRRLHIQMR